VDRQLNQEIMNAWQQAAADLGIRVAIPFILVAENGGSESYEAHIVDFGGPKGTVIGRVDDDKGSWNRRRAAGFYVSDLAPTYRKYDRKLFMDTLNDWKWFGARHQQPAWYTGKTWS
jgi:hypothetical protein